MTTILRGDRARAKTGVWWRNVAHSASLPPCPRIDSNRYWSYAYTAGVRLSREIWMFCASIRLYDPARRGERSERGFPRIVGCDNLGGIESLVTRLV